MDWDCCGSNSITILLTNYFVVGCSIDQCLYIFLSSCESLWILSGKSDKKKFLSNSLAGLLNESEFIYTVKILHFVDVFVRVSVDPSIRPDINLPKLRISESTCIILFKSNSAGGTPFYFLDISKLGVTTGHGLIWSECSSLSKVNGASEIVDYESFSGDLLGLYLSGMNG